MKVWISNKTKAGFQQSKAELFVQWYCNRFMPVQYFCTKKSSAGMRHLTHRGLTGADPWHYSVPHCVFGVVLLLSSWGRRKTCKLSRRCFILNGKNVDRHLKDGQANQWSTMASTYQLDPLGCINLRRFFSRKELQNMVVWSIQQEPPCFRFISKQTPMMELGMVFIRPDYHSVHRHYLRMLVLVTC